MEMQAPREQPIPPVELHRVHSQWQKKIALAENPADRKEALAGFVADLTRLHLQTAFAEAKTSKRQEWFYRQCDSENVLFAIRNHLRPFVQTPEDTQLIEDLIAAEVHAWRARVLSVQVSDDADPDRRNHSHRNELADVFHAPTDAAPISDLKTADAAAEETRQNVENDGKRRHPRQPNKKDETIRKVTKESATAKKPVRRNVKYEGIDRGLRDISEARPKNHEEVFQFLDDRKVSIPNRKPFKTAGGWLKGFRQSPHAASAWLSQAWGRLDLPAFARGPKK